MTAKLHFTVTIDAPKGWTAQQIADHIERELQACGGHYMPQDDEQWMLKEATVKVAHPRNTEF